MHRRHVWLGAVAMLCGLAALLPMASSSSAAPPTNDEIGGAIGLGPPPDQVVQATTEATTSNEERAWNDYCGAPSFEHAVWFTWTATEAGNVGADVSGSDYSAGVLLLRGQADNLTPLDCNAGSVAGQVAAGDTIYLLAFGDGGTEATSGQLVLDTSLLSAAPVITVSIDPRGTVDKSGVAHLSGSVSCTSDDPAATLSDVSGLLTQRVGQSVVRAPFFTEQSTPCDGAVRAWTAEAVGDGKLTGGKAAIQASGFGCDASFCASGHAEAPVQLSRARNGSAR